MSSSKLRAVGIPLADEAREALIIVQGTVETALVENHRKFLRFLVSRVGDAHTAEDILQQFYLRAVSKSSGLRKDGSVVAWLYSLLRSTLVDHFRQESTRQRHEAAYVQMEELYNEGPDTELEQTICACFETLLPTLKADYAEILQRVDLQGLPPREVARDLGLEPNTVRVRLHRARQALKHSLLLSCRTCAEHGCLDCDCGKPEISGTGAEENAPGVL